LSQPQILIFFFANKKAIRPLDSRSFYKTVLRVEGRNFSNPISQKDHAHTFIFSTYCCSIEVVKWEKRERERMSVLYESDA
jgi:hypothetical protein